MAWIELNRWIVYRQLASYPLVDVLDQCVLAPHHYDTGSIGLCAAVVVTLIFIVQFGGIVSRQCELLLVLVACLVYWAELSCGYLPGQRHPVVVANVAKGQRNSMW